MTKEEAIEKLESSIDSLIETGNATDAQASKMVQEVIQNLREIKHFINDGNVKRTDFGGVYEASSEMRSLIDDKNELIDRLKAEIRGLDERLKNLLGE